MSLTSMLDQAQGGRLFVNVARSLDLDAGQTRSAMAKLCPAIAEKLHTRAAEDEELFQSLLDLITDNGAGSPLDDGDGLTGAEAVSDGNAILDDVFGSRSAAMAALREADPGLPERELARLAPISATAVVAALAQANRPLALANVGAPQQAAGSGATQGFMGALISAIVAGIIGALTKKLTASTRRRRTTTSYSRSRTQRRTTSGRSRAPARRRTANASVEDIFKDILGKLGK